MRDGVHGGPEMQEHDPYADQIEKLNHGEHVVTYEMLQVRLDRAPFIGEIRYVVPLVPSSWEPLAAMIPLYPMRIIWTGEKWLAARG